MELYIHKRQLLQSEAMNESSSSRAEQQACNRQIDDATLKDNIFFFF